jgi:NAD(P)-dependent dehydrogenase (short-subunit alcohol dehydrogenase family)
MSPTKTLLVVGSGPGIGRAVATLFASKRYTNIVLIARRAESLAQEQAAVEAASPHANVKTYAVDITDAAAVGKALDDADAAFGKPECVFYNAARVLPSALFEHDVKEVEYDFKVRAPPFFTQIQE